jgi:hypothetical protein
MTKASPAGLFTSRSEIAVPIAELSIILAQ